MGIKTVAAACPTRFTNSITEVTSVETRCAGGNCSRIASGAHGISVTGSAGLAVSIGEQSVSEGTNGAVSSSVTCFRIGDAVLKIGGVCGESKDTARAGGGTVGRAGCARVCAFDSASVDRG